MKKVTSFLFMCAFTLTFLYAGEGYKVGDMARDFDLKGVGGENVSLSDYPDAKGYIVIFSCNHCPYVKMYEDRMVALDEKFEPMGFPVIAINPNDSTIQPEDSFSKMVVRANEKDFPFPYLLDDEGVYEDYGATRTPHVYLLEKTDAGNKVAYIGAIDNSPRNEEEVTEKYVAAAINSILSGDEVATKETKAIGCSIKQP